MDHSQSNNSQSQSQRSRPGAQPGFGGFLLRGVLWGAAMAVGAAIGGPLVPIVAMVVKMAANGGNSSADGDAGGADFSGMDFG